MHLMHLALLLAWRPLRLLCASCAGLWCAFLFLHKIIVDLLLLLVVILLFLSNFGSFFLFRDRAVGCFLVRVSFVLYIPIIKNPFFGLPGGGR